MLAVLCHAAIFPLLIACVVKWHIRRKVSLPPTILAYSVTLKTTIIGLFKQRLKLIGL
jgi:hypothetical protein